MSSVSRRRYDMESMKPRRGEYEAKRRRLQREEEPDEKQRLIDEEKEVMRHLRELLRIKEQERRQLEREEMRLVRELERTRLCQDEEDWRKKMKRPEQQRQESGHQARPDCSSKPSSSRAGSSQITRERAIEQLQKDVIAINNQEPDVVLPNYSEQQVGMLEAIPTDQRPPITVNCKLFGSIRLFPFEAQKLPQLIHNNVMSSIGFLSSQGDYLMLEKPRGESLVEYLSNKTISVSMLLIWILDIARGLHYLHSRNLAHGALYQRNVFTHGDRLKLESPLILNKWKKNNFASLWDTTLDLFAFALLIDQLVPHAKMASSEDRKDVECMKKHSRDVQRNIQSNVVFRAAMAERSGRIDENTAYQELISRFKLLPTGSSSRESLYTIEYIVSFLEDKVPDE